MFRKAGVADADIAPQTLQMVIRESFGSPWISAQIFIVDFGNLFGRIDIDGTETVTVTFASIDDPNGLSFTLQVSSKSDSITSDAKKRIVTFDLISPEFLSGAVTTVGNGFHDMKASEMVKKVYEQYMTPITEKPLHTSETDTKLDLVIPQLNVWETMEMLCRHGFRATRYQTSLYRFAETRKGFHFVNMEELMQNALDSNDRHNFIYRADPRVDLPGKVRTDILNFSLDKSDDFHGRIHSSIHRADTKTISILERNAITTKFDSRKFFMQAPFSTPETTPALIDTNTLLDGYANTPTRTYSAFNEKDWTSNENGTKAYEYIPKRAMYDRLLNNSSMTIDILGNTSIVPGSIANLSVPKASIDSQQEEETYIPGNYLVFGITHHIKPEEDTYLQKLALVRDSIKDNPENRNVPRNKV